MDTSTSENQPAAGGRDGRWHGQGGAAIAGGVIALALVLVVLLVLPGFLAGEFSRESDNVFSLPGWGAAWDECHFTSQLPVSYNVEAAILMPSGWLMRFVPAVRRFYTWQYRAVGGYES